MSSQADFPPDPLVFTAFVQKSCHPSVLSCLNWYQQLWATLSPHLPTALHAQRHTLQFTAGTHAPDSLRFEVSPRAAHWRAEVWSQTGMAAPLLAVEIHPKETSKPPYPDDEGMPHVDLESDFSMGPLTLGQSASLVHVMSQRAVGHEPFGLTPPWLAALCWALWKERLCDHECEWLSQWADLILPAPSWTTPFTATLIVKRLDRSTRQVTLASLVSTEDGNPVWIGEGVLRLGKI